MFKCRICLQTTNTLLNLFDSRESITLSFKIKDILTKIEMYPNDGLLTSICENCKQKLDLCIEFIMLCKKSDDYLRNMTLDKGDKINKASSEDNIKNKLNTEIVNVQFKEEIPNKIPPENNISVPECCTKICKQRSMLQKHQCFTCGKTMSSRFRLKTHLATHSKDKQHSCTYCKKKFSIVENLKAHTRIHTGEKPYHCSTCGETFAHSAGLIVHNRKHTGQTPYQCVLCPRSFQTISNFKYHVRVHTGERKHVCSTCSRTFITSGDLKQHIATHSGEKPYICSVCGIRFSRASNLNRHFSYLHNQEKSYACQHCPAKFVRKLDVTKHEKCHINK